MTMQIPRVRVGQPLRHEALSVFPLFVDSVSGVDYRLSAEALADQSVLVEEVSEGGSVPLLLVENKSDSRVLFLEGEELVGAKQNRILNTSVLIPAHARLKIPVSCVEQGRWGYKSRYFGSSGSHSPSKLRRTLKASVTRSVNENRGHSSDQSAVWQEVSSLHSTHSVASRTSALSDAFNSYQDRIGKYQEQLGYVAGASGVAMAIGSKVVAVDLFDKPATCEKVWSRLLTGVVFDALEVPDTSQHASVDDVERLVQSADEFPWQAAAAVGEGEEYRAQSPTGDQASALLFEGAVVHGSVVAGV